MEGIKERQARGELIHGQNQTHVAYVRVRAPQHRVPSYVYGKVSFDVGHCRSRCPVVLFSRERDDADRIDAEGYLTLSDDHESQRAIGQAISSNPFHVIMELFERRESGRGGDALIASIDHCEFGNGLELGYCFAIGGQMGYKIEVCYSVMLGARVEIGATLTKLGQGESAVSCQLVANQLLLWEPMPPDMILTGHLSLTCTPLTKNPLTLGVLDVGKPLDLERRFVVAPMWDAEHLQISIGDDGVDFPLKEFWDTPLDTLSCYTYQEARTKTIKLASGTEISVSIEFV